ncbi:MAG: bifunctional diaminohydroxyphosphoribosylaminopyrimidine deaminase/5-amino-6-(5-phosphoribosylamino)uracil reductase RibD [Opitutaceae bacterium]|nr:bifunctional diaminohydroxyphosphoribosylaminopyrimidine deaminase/5-amino-6-(5-phosphoribosylamino)uracil reductase RibD [Verrucomicrobiales bacterium]
MRSALRLARRGAGETSPNPMVGAVLVKTGKVIGRGFHRRAGQPHAEIEALRDAERRGESPRGATLFVTLEPCCTHGRTPPCTDAILAAGIKRVVAAATDPNPDHAGRGFKILRRANVVVVSGVLADQATRLNEYFNHWIVHRTPFVVAKAAMTLDGKIATVTGESKWITGEKARAQSMRLRGVVDAILVGINTVLADDPSLTLRGVKRRRPLRRIILDSQARTPLRAKVVSDEWSKLTTIVVSKSAPKKRVMALSRRAHVVVAPSNVAGINLSWLLRHLGREGVTSLLVEGGGEVHASFFGQRRVQRAVFFYAPIIVGGRNARRAVAGLGARVRADMLSLHEIEWRRVGEDLMLTGLVASPESDSH